MSQPEGRVPAVSALEWRLARRLGRYHPADRLPVDWLISTHAALIRAVDEGGEFS